jgi:hypothetical protein
MWALSRSIRPAAVTQAGSAYPDHEHNRHGERAQRGGHGAVCDIGDLVGDVRVADVLEEEVALVTDEPASEGEEELAKGRVNVEEVGALQVV